MSESTGRRIKRSLFIDTSGIKFCDEKILKKLREIGHLAQYLDSKAEEIEESNSKLGEGCLSNQVNGRRLTNLGTFRAYIECYLKAHPNINQEMTLIVRQLATEGRGIPMEIYCFSSVKEWAGYETIQADIFDHLFAIAPEFGLNVFQEPTGHDLQRIQNA
jgi:miniconductance mechanosensitive channel